MSLDKGQMRVERARAEPRTVLVAAEDLGLLVLESPQVKMTHALLQALMYHNCAVLSCNAKHLPYGLMLPMFQHHAFTEKMHAQLESSMPLRKNLWQQTVRAKILNQAKVLELQGKDNRMLTYLAQKVKSGDSENVEGRAAAFYWKQLVEDEDFVRDRMGEMPNAMFNYAYAILLAVVARSLVASGLLPALGIHHRNKYNPWCLASDIMEPYRPIVDFLVLETIRHYPEAEALNKQIKQELLKVPVLDVFIDNQRSPSMIASQRTTASLSACFEGSARKLLYPHFQQN